MKPNLQKLKRDAEEATALAEYRTIEYAAAEATKRAEERERIDRVRFLEGKQAEAEAEHSALLAEIRRLLPGCETWLPRLLATQAEYERETAEVRGTGLALNARFRPDRVLLQHPVSRVLPLLQMLADTPPVAESAPESDDHDADASEAQ